MPPERRLEYSLEQGWAPLCEFLGVEVPVGRSFPRVNDLEGFEAWVRDVRRAVVGRIVRRWGWVVGVFVVGGLGAWWARG